MDKNELLHLFSSVFSLDRDGMTLYFNRNNLADCDKVLNEFDEIRAKVYEYLWNVSQPNLTLNIVQIEALSFSFLKENYPWINEKGFKALNRYIHWICWHEGILK
ncbi:MAG: hypothetical protein K0M63_01010 [Weeksellaceae bacterium]|nr:hypothetical protein [Weeksellaceae bacterium]